MNVNTEDHFSGKLSTESGPIMTCNDVNTWWNDSHEPWNTPWIYPMIFLVHGKPPHGYCWFCRHINTYWYDLDCACCLCLPREILLEVAEYLDDAGSPSSLESVSSPVILCRLSPMRMKRYVRCYVRYTLLSYIFMDMNMPKLIRLKFLEFRNSRVLFLS
jgi:hypothetical protein